MDNAFFIVAVRRDVVSADGILIFTCRIRFAFAPLLAIERSPPQSAIRSSILLFEGKLSIQKRRCARRFCPLPFRTSCCQLCCEPSKLKRAFCSSVRRL